VSRFFSLPFTDFLHAYDRGIGRQGLWAMVWVALACGLTWWAYVPIHELLHAWGCQLAGGKVTRLDIAEGYGGSLLQQIFPYVRVGSDYAGQLSGFDTHGSDWIYAVTVFFPYLLTLLVGVPLILRVRARRHPSTGALLTLGAALPLAWAPFLSITGDYYELGSIIISRLAELLFAANTDAWRGDDLFRIAGPLFTSDIKLRGADAVGVSLSLALGLLLAFLTYALGRRFARILGLRGEPELMRGS
jgi:hypothetical protein